MCPVPRSTCTLWIGAFVVISTARHAFQVCTVDDRVLLAYGQLRCIQRLGGLLPTLKGGRPRGRLARGLQTGSRGSRCGGWTRPETRGRRLKRVGSAPLTFAGPVRDSREACPRLDGRAHLADSLPG